MEDFAVPPRPRFNIYRVTSSILVGVIMFVVGFSLRGLMLKTDTDLSLLSPLSGLEVSQKKENPYPKFRFSALRDLQLTPRTITFENILATEPTHTSYLVSWEVPDLQTGGLRKTTGQVNIPTGNGPFPLIIMMRGYVDREIYQTGVGTKNAASAFARNGYITIAPDFLGYGGSDAESEDILIARFARPLVVLQLLKNLEQPNFILKDIDQTRGGDLELTTPVSQQLLDKNRIGIWAHSNGGQIALSILEMTSRTFPTTLWAPVSKPFPYSILYYSDDLPDGGEYLRQQLSLFEYELENNPHEFSILTEPSRILAPLQIHQGNNDDAVPLEWSEELVETLEAATVSATLYTYPTADHNLQPDWNTAIQRDLQFFARYLK